MIYSILIDSLEIQAVKLIKDVVLEVLMKDRTASNLIGGGNLSIIYVNVFRLKQSLDDPKLLFWRPFEIINGEWPFIFFLKL